MVELLNIPGRKTPVRAATWKEAKPIAERIIRENRKFFEELGQL